MNKIQRVVSYFSVILGIVLLGNCASPDYKAANMHAQNLVGQAEILVKEGKVVEAYKLLDTVKNLHPGDARIQAINNSLTAEQKEAVAESPLLGFNKAKRAKVDASTGEKIAWYIPDRIFDIIDMFGVEMTVGPQIGGGVWATHALQLNTYTGATVGLGYNQKKQFGFITESRFDISGSVIGTTAVAGARVGTGGVDSAATAMVLHTPGQNLYQVYDDYWAIGGRFGLIIVGGKFEYHPIEIVDFLAGLIMLDPMGDDYATTSRLKFTTEQEDNLNALNKALKGGSIEDYRKEYASLGGSNNTPDKTGTLPAVIPAKSLEPAKKAPAKPTKKATKKK